MVRAYMWVSVFVALFLNVYMPMKMFPFVEEFLDFTT
jgi:hypothetical protein